MLAVVSLNLNYTTFNSILSKTKITKMKKEDFEKLPYSLQQVHLARQKISKEAHKKRSDFVTNWLENQKKPGEGKDITLEDKMVCGESAILEKPQPVFKERGVDKKKNEMISSVLGFYESDGSSISIEVNKRKSNANLLVHCTWQTNASDNVEKSNTDAETEREESPGGAGYSSGMFRGQKGDQYTGSPEAGSAPDKRTGKSKKEAGSLPVLPPKIDRQKKPSKKSAAERLFGRSSGDRSSGGGRGAGSRRGRDRGHAPGDPSHGRLPLHAALRGGEQQYH